MFWKAKRTYLDYAAATPTCDEALRAMERIQQHRGNPGAIHKEGVEAKARLEEARKTIARILGVKSRSVVFLSGATEGNNLAIVGHTDALERNGEQLKETHWITSSIEHPSVLESFKEIERRGGLVSYADPDERGEVRVETIAKLLKPQTRMVSLGWANGEIGTVQPLRKVAQSIRTHETQHNTRVLFHTDAGQAPLYIPSIIGGLGVDLMTLDSNKLYGPAGVGALYVCDDANLAARTFGGSQEKGLRAGSEPFTLAVGFAVALEVQTKKREDEVQRLENIRTYFIETLQKAFPEVAINGEGKQLPHIVNISFPHIQSEYITLALDHRGIAISTKSSCREGEESESHVVKTLGGEPWRASNTLRFSFGAETQTRDIDHVVEELTKLVNKA